MKTNLIQKNHSAKKMLSATLPSKKITSFIQELFDIYHDNDSDMEDYANLWFDHMLDHQVYYKQPLHLTSDLRDKCIEHYDGSVEQMFLAAVNTQAHYDVFELFKEECERYFDFHDSTLLNNRTTILNLAATFAKLKSSLITKQSA